MTDSTYVQPFTQSVRVVFETMVRMPIAFGDPSSCRLASRYDISGVIGLSGDVVGTVAMRMPDRVASEVVERFAGVRCEFDSPDFLDAIGELVNLVVGSAKARFEGKNVSISTPSVVLGSGHRLACRANTPCLTLPCLLECGEFSIDIAIRDHAVETKAA
jgi:chemotaxis protein CheX